MALIGEKRLGEFLRKKETWQSNNIGRLSYGDVRDLFDVLELSSEKAEGYYFWQLNEGRNNQREEVCLATAAYKGVKEP